MSEAIRCDICGEFAHQDFGSWSEVFNPPFNFPDTKPPKKSIAISVKMVDAAESDVQTEIHIDLCYHCAIIAINEYKKQLALFYKELTSDE